MSRRQARSSRKGTITGRRARLGRHRVIRVATALSALAFAVLTGGFAYGVYAGLGGQVGEGEPQATPETAVAHTTPRKTVDLVAIGDSLAHGFGDSTGRGFVGDVAESYRHLHIGVVESNLGLDGLTSGGMLREIREASVRRLLAGANVVLVSVGGNDLNQAAGLPHLDLHRIEKAQAKFAHNLAVILSDLHAVNPSATVVLVGLYNPYGNIQGAGTNTATVIEAWNAKEQQLVDAHSGVVLVPTADLFAVHTSRYLYVDHFHPNELGYARIASRIWQDIQPS